MTSQPTVGSLRLDLAWSTGLVFDILDVGGSEPSAWSRYYTPPPFAIVYVVDRLALEAEGMVLLLLFILLSFSL